MTTTPPHPPFEAGDHVVLPCNAAGGLIPYEHHAIVVSVGQEICGGWTLCVSDFTIDGGDDGGDDGEDGGGGIGSVGVGVGIGGIGSGSARGLLTSLANIRADRPAAGTAAGGEDRHRAAAAAGHRRGLRLLCVDAGGWTRIAYAGDDPLVDCASVVRRRVEFLLSNPHVIPPYSLVECNCECVAVWCKTGRWTTAQFRNWAGNANVASRIAVAGLSIASWSAIVVIPGAALLLSAGVVAEVVTGVWGDRARRGWEARTALLNDEFDRMTTMTTTAATTTTATIPAINGGVERI